MTLLQHEPGRIVALEPGGTVVRKAYTGPDPAAAVAMATREYQRMNIFHAALTDCPGATCPVPLELSLTTPPYLRMTRATGVPLEDCLASQPWPPARCARVGAILRRAVEVYVSACGEPYWDFLLRNMIYDPALELVTFLDFEVPPALGARALEFGRFPALEFSLGTLVGVTVFEAHRPTRIHRRRQHRHAARLVHTVINEVHPRRGALDHDPIREVAALRYGMAIGAGGAPLRAWYRATEALGPGLPTFDNLLDPDLHPVHDPGGVVERSDTGGAGRC